MKLGTIDIEKIYVGGNEIEKGYVGSSEVYETGDDYSKIPLCFKAINDNDTLTITFKVNLYNSGSSTYYGNLGTVTFEYSYDNQTWTEYSFNGSASASSSSKSYTLTTSSNIVYLRTSSPLSKYQFSSSSSYPTQESSVSIQGNVNHEIFGNITSIFYGSAFNGQRTTGSSTTRSLAYRLFEGNTKLVSAENLILPTDCYTRIRGTYYNSRHSYRGMYQSMFKDCTNLTTAPELPATDICVRAYAAMFENCTSLNSIQPFTITNFETKTEGGDTNNNNMMRMFYGCTSLTDASSITINVTGIYGIGTLSNMDTGATLGNTFNGCTNLEYPPTVTASSIGYGGCCQMFYNCRKLKYNGVSFNAVTSVGGYGCYQMYYGCSALEGPIEIKATALQTKAYYGMFNGCSSLDSIKVYFTTWPSTSSSSTSYQATTVWVYNVAATGTFVCPSSLTKTFDSSHIPSGWTVETF